MSDVWNPGSDSAPPPTPEPAAAPGALPDVVQVLSACLGDLTGNFVGFLLAGLGPSIVSIGLGLVLGVLLVVATIPGVAMEDPTVMLLGVFGGTFLLVILVICITVPMNASLYRAVWAYLDRGEPLGIGAGFSTALEDLPNLALFTIVSTVLTTLAMFACYLPALGVSLLLSMAMPAMIVHKLPALEAIGMSARHARDHLAWHLGFWALGFAILLVAMNIPIIGMMIGMPLYIAYHLRIYRSVFGSGSEPSPVS